MPRAKKYGCNFDGLSTIINNFEELQKDETMKHLRTIGLKAGFHHVQESTMHAWTHRYRETFHTQIYSDEPLHRNKNVSSIGIGFVFDNSIPPLDPNARGGIIVQYLMYGTKVFGTPRVAADTKLYMALGSQKVKNEADKKAEEVILEEIAKILSKK